MRTIFLDIDGVLNGDLFISTDDKPGILIDNTRLDLIKQIVDATGAKIVLSSSWKEHWEKVEKECDETGKEINAIFASCGLKIYDKTIKYHNDRKKEIVDWLKAHPDVTNFAVIDDSPFEEGILTDHFVLTSRLRYGIDRDDARKAILILNGKSE